MFLALHSVCHAQPAQTWDEQTGTNRRSENAGKFSKTEMKVDHRVISFTNLPDLPGLSAVISDPDGTVVAQKELSRISSLMDARGLRKGKLYYVTLYYNSKTEKAFVLHL